MTLAQDGDDLLKEASDVIPAGAYFAPRPAFGKRVSIRLGGRS